MKYKLILIIALLTSLYSVLIADDDTYIINLASNIRTPTMSQSETDWLSNNHTIKVYADKHDIPYNYISESTQCGLALDYVKLLSILYDINIEYVELDSSESELTEELINGNIDIIPNGTITDSDNQLLYSQPISRSPYALFSVKTSNRDFAGEIIAVCLSDNHYSKIINLYPEAIFRKYSSEKLALEATALGEADVAVATLTGGNSIITNFGLMNLNIIGKVEIPDREVGMIFNSELTELHSIFSNLYLLLDPSIKNSIAERYINKNISLFESNRTSTIQEQPNLTTEEKAWLENNHTLTIFIRDIAPYVLKEDPVNGMMIEYLNTLFSRLNIYPDYIVYDDEDQITFHQNNLNTPHMIFDLPPKSDLSDFYYLSEVIHSQKRVIFTRKNNTYISSIDDLTGKSIAVIENEFISEIMSDENSQLYRLVYVDDVESALLAVATGRADSWIGDLNTGTFQMNESGISSIKIASPLPLEEHKIRMAIPHEHNELNSIFSKLLIEADPLTMLAIESKYLENIRYEYGVTENQLAVQLFVIISTSLFIMVIFLIRSIRTRRELNQTNIQLKNYSENLEKMVEERTRTIESTQTYLIQTEKMAALGRLISSITHEINSPLGAIRSCNDSISSSFDDIQHRLSSFIEWSSDAKRAESIKILMEKIEVKKERFLSYKEKRTIKKEIQENLENQGIEPDTITVNTLIDFYLKDMPEGCQELFKGEENLKQLQLIRDLMDIARSSKVIEQAEERAAKTIKAMKSYVYKSGTERKKEVDINENIRNILSIFYNTVKLRINLNLNLNELPPIITDPERMSQVWSNLVENATQAIEGKGEISISTRREGKFAIIEISDTGKGIPEEITDKIFDPFFTTKPTGKGSGIGLDIVKRFVYEEKGTIDFISEKDVGTTFTITLPIEA